jgi:hypothetical protein
VSGELTEEEKALMAPILASLDESVLRTYLCAMPSGNYHRKDDGVCIYREGRPVCSLLEVGEAKLSRAALEGLAAALIYLLNHPHLKRLPWPTSLQP